MSSDPHLVTPDPEALRRALTAHRDLVGDQAVDRQVERVYAWDEVVSQLRQARQALEAVAVLGPGDLAPVDLDEQGLSKGPWPPPCPVVALDASWVLSTVPDGRVLLLTGLGSAPR